VIKHSETLSEKFGRTLKLKALNLSNINNQTKKVIEKSYFSRGNKIIVTGIKKDETNFLAKKYSKTPYSLVEKITYIREDGTIETTSERAEAE